MKLVDYINFRGSLPGFFMFFFVIFGGKFGISDLILEATNSWNIIFNIGVWFVLVLFCMNEFFKEADNARERRLKKESTGKARAKK